VALDSPLVHQKNRTDNSFSGAGSPTMFWFYALGFFVFLSLGFFFILNSKQKYEIVLSPAL